MRIWKEIGIYKSKNFTIDCTGLYQASNDGEIRSLDRSVVDARGRKQRFSGRVLKQYYNKRESYYYVVLSIDKNTYTIKTHRLVCTAFHKNPYNLPCVNHKDENKMNNCADNLEWCDYLYNSNYGTAIERSAAKRRETVAIPVVQMQKDGKIVKIWKSTHDAEVCGFNHNSVNTSIRENRLYNGFVWRRLSDIEISESDIQKYLSADIVMYSQDYNRQAIVQLDADGNILKIWDDKPKLAEFGYCYPNVLKCVNGIVKMVNGYKWSKLSNFNLSDSEIEIYTNAEPLPPCKPHSSCNKKIAQYDSDGNLIHKYNSLSEAATTLGCKVSGIVHNAKGRSKSYFGYIWRYV